MAAEEHEIVRVVIPVNGDWHDVRIPGVIVGATSRRYYEVELWVRDTGDADPAPRRLRAVAAGQKFPASAASVSSVVDDAGLVFHLVEDLASSQGAARS